MTTPQGQTVASNGRFDLAAKRRARDAAAAEAAKERWGFDWGDPPQTFTLAPAGQWPANAKRLFDNGDLAEFLDVLLDKPEDFWAIRPIANNDDITDLLTEYMKWAGVGEDLGEAAESPQPALTKT